MNPLPSILKVTQKNKWYSMIDLSTIVGYQLKLAGFDWRTMDDLARCMICFHQGKFIEHNPDNVLEVRVVPVMYESI